MDIYINMFLPKFMCISTDIFVLPRESRCMWPTWEWKLDAGLPSGFI